MRFTAFLPAISPTSSFPTSDPTVSLLLAFGSFGVAFLIRPLGAMVLGTYADRHGRKKSLLLSINLMMLGGAMITFMPGYATLGVAAPLLILVARLIQGFSAGGEFGSSTAFLVEHFPERKAFIASWQFATQGASTLMASAFGLGLAQWLTTEQIQEWGWRIPFAFGLLIGPVGLWIRRHVHEPGSLCSAQTPEPAHPVKRLFGRQKATDAAGDWPDGDLDGDQLYAQLRADVGDEKPGSAGLGGVYRHAAGRGDPDSGNANWRPAG